MSDVLTEKIVRTRKPHICFGCGRQFPKDVAPPPEEPDRWGARRLVLRKKTDNDTNQHDFEKGEQITMKEYIDKIDAVTIPVLPREQRVEYCNKDEAFEAGWKTCQEYIATCIEGDDVISREAAIHEVESIYSPYGEVGTGDAISREVVLSKLRKINKPEPPEKDSP